jgi:hypothetical protein
LTKVSEVPGPAKFMNIFMFTFSGGIAASYQALRNMTPVR